MGAKASTAVGGAENGVGHHSSGGGGATSALSPRSRAFSSSSSAEVMSAHGGASNGHHSGGGAALGFGFLRPPTQGGGQHGERHRARSLSSVPDTRPNHDALPLPVPLRLPASTLQLAESPETDTSSPEDHILDSPLAAHLGLGRFYTTHSLPAHIWSLNGIKCPVCSKFVLPDDIECHLVMCLTKPRLIYNEDVLTDDKGECVICLEDLQQGDTIARLPCLCIYHKSCIDRWFEVNRSCPEHPGD